MNESSSLKDVKLAFIGAGTMGEAIIAGLLGNRLVSPEQIVGSHPRQDRRDELESKYSIHVVEDNKEAVALVVGIPKSSIVVLTVKPQRGCDT